MILWATIGVHAGRFALISEKIFLSAMPAGRFCENLPADNFLSVQMQTNFDINIAWSFVICKNLVHKLYTNRNEPGNMKIKWSGGQLLEFMQDDSFSKIKLMQKYIDSRWFLKKSSCLQASIGNGEIHWSWYVYIQSNGQVCSWPKYHTALKSLADHGQIFGVNVLDADLLNI